MSFKCFALPCTAPHREHFVLDRKQLEDGGIVWAVSAKTFFEIAMCYVRSKENHCNCKLEIESEQCNWCKSVSQILFAASHFYYQNVISKKVVTCFMTEFARQVPCYDCLICAQNKRILAYALKTKMMINEKEREQYLFDYDLIDFQFIL